ncbi:hypothetical protein ZWY2020_056431 [Hordeum vulgare]|nr:hypothetical protein ZWY2020_056431 [Hordeum vulgare]
MAAAAGVSPSSLLRLPRPIPPPPPRRRCSSAGALLSSSPSPHRLRFAAIADSSNGNGSYSGKGYAATQTLPRLNLMETVSMNEDTGKGAMWELEKSLDQPMDAEAGD